MFLPSQSSLDFSTCNAFSRALADSTSQGVSPLADLLGFSVFSIVSRLLVDSSSQENPWHFRERKHKVVAQRFASTNKFDSRESVAQIRSQDNPYLCRFEG